MSETTAVTVALQRFVVNMYPKRMLWFRPIRQSINKSLKGNRTFRGGIKELNIDISVLPVVGKINAEETT